jgi:hypothetical protein
MLEDALDLIKRQQAEIERLERILDKSCDVCPSVTTAIKKFAEKFKKKAGSIVTSCQGYEIYETKQYQISAINFDNLVKEMTEVKEN